MGMYRSPTDTHGATPMTVMPTPVPLTAKILKSKIKYATDHGVPLTLTDSEVRGFSARISPKGRVTWVATKSIGRGRGSMHRVVLGHFPGMTLEDARIEAGQTISRLARGEDVVSQVKAKKLAKVALRLCPTIKDAVADYLKERETDPEKDSTSRYEIELAHLFNRQIVPELGASKRINEVSKADIKAMLKKRRDSGHYVAARNLYVLIRPFFQWCISEEYISTNPCADIDAPEPAQKRQHKLSTQEIIALWSASYSCSNELKTLGCYWRLLLMLIQRRSEIAGMRWREINLDRAEWIIPSERTKNGREHLVPLPTQAVAELRVLLPTNADYVFGKYPDKPFSGFSKAKLELDGAMLTKLAESNLELRHWRIHDLRRTGASHMAGLKVAPYIIEAILNHTPPALEGTYQVWELYKYADEKREALQIWADQIDSLTKELVSIG